MDPDLIRRIIRDGLILLFMAAVVMVLVHYSSSQVETAQKEAAQDKGREFRAELEMRGVNLGPAAQFDEYVHVPREEGQEHWALVNVPIDAAYAMRDHLRQLDNPQYVRRVCQNNNLAMESLNLPLGKPPKWWYDPRKLGASIVVIANDDGTTADVLYLGVSYATGQIYACHWTGPSTHWKNRPDLKSTPATLPARSASSE